MNSDKYEKVCIFDIDNTLTHGAKASENTCPNTIFENRPEPAWPVRGGTNQFVKQVVQKCKDKGYGLAIASAESGDEAINQRQYTFLSNINSDFNPQFLQSPRYQTSCSIFSKPYCLKNEYADKTAMYQNIMNYYNIPPANWNQSIVFDDVTSNLCTANRLGFKTCQASPECGGSYCEQGCGIGRDCLNVIT